MSADEVAYRALGVMSHATGLDQDEQLMEIPALMACPVCDALMGAHQPDRADRCLIDLGRKLGKTGDVPNG